MKTLEIKLIISYGNDAGFHGFWQCRLKRHTLLRPSTDSVSSSTERTSEQNWRAEISLSQRSGSPLKKSSSLMESILSFSGDEWRLPPNAPLFDTTATELEMKLFYCKLKYTYSWVLIRNPSFSLTTFFETEQEREKNINPLSSDW